MNPQMTKSEEFSAIKDVKNTYKGAQDLSDEAIKTQMNFAKLLIQKDINNGVLDTEFKDMGIVYLTCHYLYLNHSAIKSDSLESSSKTRAIGQLGKGYEASFYGQQYALLTNKEKASEEKLSSGVIFL
ncbi:hypothetical protein [uncultured Cetobacterium sp.]|uniref:hypothetical protein n=2 Tax=uncultured Cetobacterium sp. TaxID=527638 RepID=UPI0026371416|nr:hypothetical protein [uncultured Cetobacterium sp.]